MGYPLKFFQIASSVATPLALGGLFVAIFAAVITRIIGKGRNLSQVNAKESSNVISLIVNCVFVLALAAMSFGLLGYVFGQAKETTTPQIVSCVSALILVYLFLFALKSHTKPSSTRKSASETEQSTVQITTQSAQHVDNLSAPKPGENRGFKIIHRHITCHFVTPTMCLTTHHVLLTATSKNIVTKYRGRHPVYEENEPMLVSPPHRLLSLDELIDNWQSFTLQLEPPLSQDVNCPLSMKFKWSSSKYIKEPDTLMIPFVEHGAITFLVSFEPSLRITQPIGEVTDHAGSRDLHSQQILEIKDNCIQWSIPNPKLQLLYRVHWKWLKARD